MDVTGKIAIVTGASQGIGRATCLKYAAHGMKVVMAARNQEKLQEIKTIIDTQGKGAAIVVPTDVTDEKAVKKLVETTLEHFGQIDVLVNNAGVGGFKRADEFTVDDYNWMFDVNVKGVFLVTKYVVPHMIERQQGSIINIASVAGKTGFKMGTLYSATKHAVVGYTWSLREDLKEHKIAVSVVCPGSVVTRFGGTVKDKVEWAMEAEDVANACFFLASEADTVNTAEIIIKPRYNPRTIQWDE